MEHTLYKVQCANCGQELLRRDRGNDIYVCNLKCQHEYRSKKQCRIVHCPICNKEIVTTAGKIKHKVGRTYCSEKCHKLGVTLNTNSKLGRNLREYIRRRDGWQCRLCKYPFNQLILWNPYFSKYPPHPYRLDVHHIDADKANNNTDNLITLCVSCHRLITLHQAKMLVQKRKGHFSNWREELFYMRKGAWSELPKNLQIKDTLKVAI